MAAASLQWRTSVKDWLYFCLTSFQTKSTAPSGSTSLPRSMFLASCPATHCSNSLIWNVLFTCLLLEEPHPLSQLEALSSFLYFRDLSLLFESHVYIFSPCLSCKFCPVDLVSPFGHPTAETWAFRLSSTSSQLSQSRSESLPYQLTIAPSFLVPRLVTSYYPIATTTVRANDFHLCPSLPTVATRVIPYETYIKATSVLLRLPKWSTVPSE